MAKVENYNILCLALVPCSALCPVFDKHAKHTSFNTKMCVSILQSLDMENRACHSEHAKVDAHAIVARTAAFSCRLS